MLSRGKKMVNLALQKASDQASHIASSNNYNLPKSEEKLRESEEKLRESEEKLRESDDIETDVATDILLTDEVGIVEIIYFDLNGEELSREKCTQDMLDIETTASKSAVPLNNENVDTVDNTSADPDYLPEELLENSGNNNNDEQPRKRSKRQNVDSSKWHSKKQKLHREQGLKYEGRKKTNNKISYGESKLPRSMKPRCKCTDEKILLRCSSFDDDERLIIFTNFWKKTWDEKKIFVQLLTEATEVERPRGRKNNESRRKQTFKYFFKKEDNRIRVCKTFFINTLNIGDWAVLNWKKKETSEVESEINTSEVESEINTSEVESEINTSNENKSSKQAVARKNVYKERNASLCNFFNSLSKVESHYCRSQSTKLYLEPIWKSLNAVYKFYVEDWCRTENEQSLSIAAFSIAFDNNNLSLYAPKKDLCDLCVSHETKNISDEEFKIHQEKKTEAREEKKKDKESDHALIFTMDLQSLLLSPKSNVSSMYYKTKLAVHNFTIYNLKSNDGHCFLWNETEGNLTAQEFTTIIGNFILSCLPLPENITTVIIFSDGCGYQNRNVTLSNALINIAVTENITIEQKFLEKGHTQMEVDSMHSLIERKLKNTNINIPADYVNICKSARKQPSPYNVHYLEHTYFKNLSEIKSFNSIRPGRNVGDLTVNNIRALKYSSDGNISYKIRFSEDWTILPSRRNSGVSWKRFSDLPSLYNERLKIKKSKFEHLQSLKTTLLPDYHDFYDNIPYV